MQSQAADIADALTATVADLTDREKRIAVALYQILANGDPVSPQTLAERVEEATEAVTATLEQWPGVFRDDQARVVGFWGLALGEMNHRFQADGGKPIYAWCALDPFLVVPVIGRAARVRSEDPVTGEAISMTVTPDGLTDLNPKTTVVSLLQPQGPLGHDVIQTFCHYVMFFASTGSAHEWVHQHEHTVVLPAAVAFELGKRAWLPLRAATCQ